MPIPQFNKNGLLPEGIHSASIKEIKERFCCFGDIRKRQLLFSQFCGYVEEVKKHKVKFYICIDGSYVTNKVSPGDLDVLIFYDFTYNKENWLELIDDREVKLKFCELQVISALLESFSEEGALEFAQDVKEIPNIRKGIVRVIL